jgi:riboflavin kinase/FMN adenylyltransferase
MKLTAQVIAGAGLGSKIGFPTANLNAAPSELPHGVYAVQVGSFLGAMNWGPQPSFNGTEPRAEIFIIDFEGDLYGKDLEVHIGPRLRDIQKFKSSEELAEQISKDVLIVEDWGKQL